MSARRLPYPNTPAAEAKVEEALRLIEQAQNILDRAAQQLCPIIGLVKEWQRVGTLSDKCKAEWHRLNELVGTKPDGERLRNGLRLDSEPDPRAKPKCILGDRCEGCNVCGVAVNGELRKWGSP